MATSRGACRRPTIADVLILIAALGVGFGVTRRWLILEMGWLSRGVPFQLLYLTIPCMATLTIAWMVIRWRSPRPDRLRLMRQPGLFACCGLILTAMIALAVTLAMALLGPPSGGSMLGISAEEMVAVLVPILAGYGVLPSWGLLAISGRWRREPGWIDITGILLDVYWVIISLVGTKFELF